jgi:tripartite-type tricarboxylate transporter receptor subunit TctC
MFPHMYANLKFDPIKDLVGVGGVAEGGLVILTRPDAPWKTLAEMIQYGKGKPSGAISYASAGIGSNAYLFSEIFAQTVGLEFLHVPYKGSSAALADIVSGQVDFVFDGPSTAIPQVDSGRVRALAFSTKNRSSFMPNTPTLNEAGAKGFGQRTWLAFFAPAGTPSAITKKLSDSIGAFVPTPAFRKELGGLAHEPMPMTGEALTSMIKEEAVQWGATLKALKLQPSK